MANNNAVTIVEIGMEYEFPEGFSLGTMQSDNYIKELKKLDKLPFSKADIRFSDDSWDFAPYTKLNVSKNKMKFKFFSLNETYRDEIKTYALIRVLSNLVKIQSISKSLYTINKFFCYIESRGVFSVKDLPVSYVKDYFNQIEKSESIQSLRRKKMELKDFYDTYAANFEDLFTPELNKLFDLGDYRAFKAIKKEAKLPDIHKDYFDKLVSSCIVVMDDIEADLLFRAIACVIIILSQTGIRIGECLGLTDDCLQTIKIFNGEETNYITYRTWKRESGNNTSSINRTYVNELTKKAYLKLLELHKEKRRSLDMHYLFMGGPQMNQTKFFPIDCDSFMRMERRFFAYMDRYLPTINVQDIYPELHTCCPRKNNTARGQYPYMKTLTFPTNHQYRVHVCTELYNKGVPLKYIQKFMAHLSSEMQSYYIRPKNNPQEDMAFSIKTLNDIVSSEVKLLGGSNGLTEKIQVFIDENHYNVEKDLDIICEKLAENIPIRQKTGGVCIKSSILRECSTDAKTNQFYCAYGVCPNIFHFYYMADVSYRQAKELVETIGINKSRGHMRQVQKELNMLQSVITNKLIPELEELNFTINKKGVEKVLIEHPELHKIIENFDTIEQEVSAWKSMK